MSDPKRSDLNDSWPEAAYSMFETDIVRPLPLNLEGEFSGVDLPDVKLDALCDVILRSFRPMADQ